MNCITVSCTALMENESWQKVGLTWYPILPLPANWNTSWFTEAMITQSIHYQQLFTRCSCQKMTVSLSKKYTEQKKRYMYSQCKITLKRSNNLHILFYLEMQKCIQSSENEYHDKSWKINVYRSVWFQEGSKFENAISKCTFKARSLLKWLPMCTIYFLDIYQTPLGNKTFN